MSGKAVEREELDQSWKDGWKLQVPGHADLLEMHRALRQQLMERWQRALPFAEGVFDRWERARFLGFGEEASIYDSSIVIGDVKVGAHTWIGPSTVLDGSGGLVIGSYCSISAGVQIYTHDSVAWSLTGGKAGLEKGPVVIGDNCYIGPQSIIARDVAIGASSIVGANSFVNKAVPPFTMVAGNPARRIGRIVINGERVTVKRSAEGS